MIVLHIYMLVVCCHYMHQFLAYPLHSCSLGNVLLWERRNLVLPILAGCFPSCVPVVLEMLVLLAEQSEGFWSWGLQHWHMHLACVWGRTWRLKPACFRPRRAAPCPQKSEVAFQGPAPLLGLPTPGDKKSAWSKVTAAQATCPPARARGWQPGEPVPRTPEPGGEREGRGPGEAAEPCPWPASTGSAPGEPGWVLQSCLSPSLREAEDIRTAAAFMGELAVSRGLAAARYLACHKHRLKFLRIKAKVR